MKLRLILTCAAAIGMAFVAAAAEPDCRPVLRAALDSKTDLFGGPTVPMTIQGRTYSMLVDTGGVYSMLKKHRVAELGLAEVDIRALRFRGGGHGLDRGVRIGDFELGQMKGTGTDMLVMPDDIAAPDVDGTLAPDFLSQFDVELDLVHGKINLFDPNRCATSPVYWSKTYDVMPITTERWNHIFAIVNLDGKELRAQIDTGTSLTLMSMVVAKDVFGLTETDPAMTRNYSKSGELKGYSYPFKAMVIGSARINNPPVKLSLFAYRGQGPQMLIGMTTLRQFRLYISYKDMKIYATPADAQ